MSDKPDRTRSIVDDVFNEGLDSEEERTARSLEHLVKRRKAKDAAVAAAAADQSSSDK